MSTIYYNPLDERCKSITGGVATSEEVTFNLFHVVTPSKGTPTLENCAKSEKQASFVLNKDGEECVAYKMLSTAFGWQITLKINQTGLYFYRFRIEGEGDVCENEAHFGELNAQNGRSFLLTVFDCKYKTPEWFKGGVMYQIFPDRFAKGATSDICITPDIIGRIRRDDWGGEPSYKPNAQGKVLNNDFFGGNLQGIKEKLGYLKDLGVTVIYLNPIFEAASNHRYDTSDYMKIDPILGKKEDFEELVETAKNQGIRVILDGVFNHTGDDSVYFNKYGNYPSVGAYQSKDSPYYSWYSFKEFPDKYESWWGIDILPEVNEQSEDYQNFIFGEEGVLKTWLKSGISGYRLDVADELPDFFLKNLRKSVKSEDKNAIIIGEVWEDASDKIAYSKRREYLQGYELDSVMNYPLKDALIAYIKTQDEQILLKTVRKLIDHYPKQTLDCLMNILGTHDTARILTVLGGIVCQNKDEMASEKAYLSENERKKAIEKLKMAALLQFTLPGVPCVYYGDENGMEGHIDPFCRQCFEWEHLNENLISYYSKLGKIRKNYKSVFKDGEFLEKISQDGFLLFERKKNKKSVFIYVNNSSKNYILKCNGKYEELLTEKEKQGSITVSPYSYGIFVKKN